jgi:hypothetical protein
MTDKKKRFYRLLERQINGLRKEAVELIYGKGSRIEVHSWTHNIKGDTFIFELIVHLGDTINESVIDKNMAEALLKEALQFFYPEVKNVNCMVRFDV